MYRSKQPAAIALEGFMHTNLTAQQQDLIIRMWENGRPVRAIAAATKTNREVVLDFIRDWELI